MHRYRVLWLWCSIQCLLLSTGQVGATLFDSRIERRIPVPGGEIAVMSGTLAAQSWMVEVNLQRLAPTRWIFSEGDVDAAVFLKRWGFPDDAINKLLTDAIPVLPEDNEGKEGAIALQLPAKWLYSLKPDKRLAVYRELEAQSDNNLVPIYFNQRDYNMAKRILKPESFEVLVHLLMPHASEGFWWFCPDSVFRQTISDIEEWEKVRLVISRTRTLIPYFVCKGGEANAILAADYFDLNIRREESVPMFFSLAFEGLPIDLVHLLPNSFRDLAYTYPITNGELRQIRPDCRWTAYLFNSLEFALPSNTSWDHLFADDHWLVSGSSRYGDVVLMAKSNGTVVHAAIYIADDLYFTKNSEHVLQPWVFMSQADMQEIYPVIDPSENITLRHHRFYRKGDEDE